MDDTTINDRLLPGERIVWTGRPAQGVMFTGRDIFMVPFSLMWCGFAVFWEFTATATGAPGFFALWGLPFVCVGLFMVFGRFVADAWLRGRTHYALTDQRVLILRSNPFGAFTTLNIDRLPDAQLRERGNRRGSIRFGSATGIFGQGGRGYWLPSLDPTPQFLAIDDARRVFELVQRGSMKRT